MKRIIPGVYGIKCTATGKWYVGASKDVHYRLKTHFSEMKRYGPMHQDAMQYGIESMKGEVIEYVEFSLLQETEAYWIEKLDSINNGYNGQSSRTNIHWTNTNV